jgi:GT2 family glycosyltransferase
MRFSVIVPTYRRPEFVQACLGSILNGDTWPDEVVVVTRPDDAASQEVLARFRDEVGGRFLVTNAPVERAGQPAALNAGIGTAGGDVLLFLDDDVVVHRDWLRRMKAGFDDPATGGVGGRDVIFDDGVERPLKPAARVGEITWYGRLFGNHWRPPAFREARPVQHLKGSNMGFRREFLAECDERFLGASVYNDTDLCLSAIERGARLIYNPNAKVDHHGASRQFAGERDDYAAENVRQYTHNKSYCLLKHLSPARRWAFMVFSVLVGQGQAFGIAKMVGTCFTKGPRFSVRAFAASMRGHAAAWRTYRLFRRSER